MSAMEMMMKSMGIDPSIIKKQVEDAGENFKAVCKNFDDKLNAQNEKLDKIIIFLQTVSQDQRSMQDRLHRIEQNQELILAHTSSMHDHKVPLMIANGETQLNGKDYELIMVPKNA